MNIKLRKLFGMSAGEIAFRLKHKVSLLQERAQFRSGKFTWDDAAWSKRLCCDVEAPLEVGQLSEWWQNHMRTRDEPAKLVEFAKMADAKSSNHDRNFSKRVQLHRHLS